MTGSATGPGRISSAVDLDGYPFRPQTFDLDGLRLSYLDEGDGQPVVMLHGNPSWSYMYRRLVAALPSGYRAIVPDHIGMGRSAKPSRSDYPHTLARRVEDLSRLLEHLVDDERVTLVVHDWGGMIGLAWALQRPRQLTSLVVLNTAGFPLMPGKRLPLPLQVARIPLFGDLLVKGANAFAQGAARLGVRRRLSPHVRRGFLAPYDRWSARVGVHEFVRDIPLRPRDPSWSLVAGTGEQLHRLTDVPTLICWGLADPVLDPDFLDEWERRLPRAEIHRFPDAGHLVLEDAADQVVPLIVDFVTRTAPARAG